MNKILITGGAGYIGSILSELLLNSGYKVTVYDNLLFKQTPNLHLFGNPDYRFIFGDVRDSEQLLKLVSVHDTVIPLAAIVGAPACDKYKQESTDINFKQVELIVKNISSKQQLIVPNTNSQYGSSKDIITEDSPFKPLSHYSVTKCNSEKALMDSANGIALRLATVFGVSPRMRLDLLVNDFTFKSLSDGYLVLFESQFKRNYIHVRDVAMTFLFAIQNYESLNGQAFNVGLSEANLSKMELALKIKEHIPKLVIKEEDFSQDKDKRDYIVSNSKLEGKGWKPMLGIDFGIKEIISAYPVLKNKLDANFTNL